MPFPRRVRSGACAGERRAPLDRRRSSSGAPCPRRRWRGERRAPLDRRRSGPGHGHRSGACAGSGVDRGCGGADSRRRPMRPIAQDGGARRRGFEDFPERRVSEGPPGPSWVPPCPLGLGQGHPTLTAHNGSPPIRGVATVLPPGGAAGTHDSARPEPQPGPAAILPAHGGGGAWDGLVSRRAPVARRRLGCGMILPSGCLWSDRRRRGVGRASRGPGRGARRAAARGGPEREQRCVGDWDFRRLSWS